MSSTLSLEFVPLDDSVDPEGESSSSSPCSGFTYSKGVAALGESGGVSTGSCKGGASFRLDAPLV
jgi:hypothetical protein